MKATEQYFLSKRKKKLTTKQRNTGRAQQLSTEIAIP